MIAFFLSMPHVASWNGQWSGEGKIYARVRKDSDVPKEYVDQTFEYTWSDGWGASVSVEHVDAKEAAKIRKQSAGFCGYDWMIDSIIDHGKIMTPEEFIEENGDDTQKRVLEIYGKIGCPHNKDFTEIYHASVGRKDLSILVDEGFLDPNTELYVGGPTVNDILRFMTKYKDILYILVWSFKENQFHFEKFYENPYSSTKSLLDTKQELDNLLRGASKEKDYSGNDEYVFD